MKLIRTFHAFVFASVFLCALGAGVHAQQEQENPSDAETVIARAVAYLGGERYLKITTQISRGKFSVIRDGVVVSFQSFHDTIVFPDKERTEFRSGKIRNVQANFGEQGWVYDGNMDAIRDQTEIQLQNFRRGMRVSLDNLLRGYWRGQATLEYVGRRPATLGKRNDVIKLTYDDGFTVEFEIGADDGVPAKAIHVRLNMDNEEIVEEDRYAQFIENAGVRSPFVIDRFTNGTHTSRINVESIQYDRPIAGSIFDKPADVRTLRRSLQL
ncbi:MAG TPA: hypothetical protein PKD24_07885 [Pyrinomonadaceae bacterium]|nr:hypothetical protein [Pyrinomonadaceae bacterium]